MARTASKTKPLTYAISYGLGGGKHHSRVLLKMLRRAGYQEAKTQNADIVIAHSAGTWLLPPDAKPKLLIYIGMPLNQSNPRKTLAEANRHSFRRNNMKTSFRVKSTSLYYNLKQPKRNLAIVRMARVAQPVIFPGTKTIFIVNRLDPWPKSDKLDSYVKCHDWSFINVEGSHDDIWDNPGRYVEIINYYAGLLG